MDEVELTKEYIDGKLREMHRTMTELFQFDFPYFKDVKVLGKSEAREYLTERGWINTEKGASYNAFQWAHIQKYLSGNDAGDFFENMAFYDKKGDTLCISRNLLLNQPEMVIPVCVHELAEKLVSTLSPSWTIKGPEENSLAEYINRKGPEGAISLEEFLSSYKEAVFKCVFKEGLCEAISLKTLSASGLKGRADSIEKELQHGHKKWVDILIDLENLEKGVKNQNIFVHPKKDEKERLRDVEGLVIHILRGFQMIKSISYHLGYPIAKEILDEHGIEGIKAALKNPPLRAEYFVHPPKYISLLKIQKRR